MKTRAIISILLTLVLSVTAIAQDTDRIDPKLTNTPLPTYVIRNARIVTVSGADIENGMLVIINGRIAQVASMNVHGSCRRAGDRWPRTDCLSRHDRSRHQHGPCRSSDRRTRNDGHNGTR